MGQRVWEGSTEELTFGLRSEGLKKLGEAESRRRVPPGQRPRGRAQPGKLEDAKWAQAREAASRALGRSCKLLELYFFRDSLREQNVLGHALNGWPWLLLRGVPQGVSGSWETPQED